MAQSAVSSSLDWSLRFALLGSGSSGNSMVVQSHNTLLMVDCGFTIKETVKRLAVLGIRPEALDAILVTHEHGDHLSGVAPFSRRYQTPVWMTCGTFAAARDKKLPHYHLFHAHESFSMGDIDVTPFPVPHDAREPCQFVFQQTKRLAIATDLGMSTPHVVSTLQGCDGLVLEANHDCDMLRDGPYPPSLQRRVGGVYGHLNNRQAVEILRQCQAEKLSHLVLAHLSDKNNAPEAVRKAFEPALLGFEGTFTIADQDAPSAWLVL